MRDAIITEKEITVSPPGTGRIKFHPGHYCGQAYGYLIKFENWIMAKLFHGPDGFSSGGVISFKDIFMLALKAEQYLESHPHTPLYVSKEEMRRIRRANVLLKERKAKSKQRKG